MQWQNQGKPKTASFQVTNLTSVSPSTNPVVEKDNIVPVTDASRRKSSRGKKNVPGLSLGSVLLVHVTNYLQEPEPPLASTTSSARRSKKSSAKKSEDVASRSAEVTTKDDTRRLVGAAKDEDASDDNDGGRRAYDEDDDEDNDPFRGGFLGASGPSAGISSTLRALSGMVSGVSSRLRDILVNLKKKEEPSLQLIALQDLSEILLVSTEDNLSGHFSPDQFVKELVVLMQPSEFGEENPEMMLLACRCIANLMEALPPSTANVVYGGAVPILCQKLLEIHFIDLAEQALSVGHIQVEFGLTTTNQGADAREDFR